MRNILNISRASTPPLDSSKSFSESKTHSNNWEIQPEATSLDFNHAFRDQLVFLKEEMLIIAKKEYKYEQLKDVKNIFGFAFGAIQMNSS